MAPATGGEQRQRRRVLGLLVSLLPPVVDLAVLRERLGGELAADAAFASPDEGRGGAGPADAQEAAAAVRAVLGGPRQAGIGKLVAVAAAAGALDGGLALEVVEGVRPARALAAVIGGGVVPGGPAAARLAELAERHLGGDAARWRGLHDALGAHRGTLPELLADVPPPVGGTVPLPPRSVAATLGLLLEHAAPEHAGAALAALPGSAVRELLSGGSLPGPGLVRAVAEHGDRRSRTALAGHSRIDARDLKRLVAADDPAVNAAVYRNPHCTPSLRRAIAHRIGTVPLDPELRAALVSGKTGGSSRTLLAPLLGCGDPELAGRALGEDTRRVAQRYALLRVWECAGPGAVRGMLDDPAVRRYLHSSVAADVAAALGEEGGAARLRAEGEPYEDPATLPRLLSSLRGTSSLRDVLNEPYAHDFAALAAANRAAPFMPKAAEEMVRHEDAADADRADFRLTLLNECWRQDGRRGGNLTPPAARLAGERLDRSAATWATGVVRAGLLDPVELVTAARPAVHAVEALAAVRTDGRLGDRARQALGGLAREHLAGHPEAWAVLPGLVGDFTGTLAELIAVCGQVAGPRPDPVTAAARPTAPRPAAPPATAPVRAAAPEPPPESPRLPRQRAALAAADLLIRLAGGTAPLPADPGALRFLAAHEPEDSPAWATPDWLVAAHEAAGLPWTARRWTAPTREEALESLARPHTDRTWAVAEKLYAYGIATPDDLLAAFPAHRLLALPHDWRRLAFPLALSGALAALLRRELGTDADAWLRLAAAARPEARDARWNRYDGPTWPELLERSRTLPVPGPDELGAVDHGDPATSYSHTVAPATAEDAARLLERGNHLWTWPLGTLLHLAGPDALAAVLPRTGPDGPWLLAAHLLRHRPTPRTAFDHLLALRDPAALDLLVRQARFLDEDLVRRLTGLGDPALDLVLLRSPLGAGVHRRIVAASGGSAAAVAAALTAELERDPDAVPPGGRLWLRSAEPDLIEAVLVRTAKDLDLPAKVTGCLGLLRHGGPERLAALAESGVLGAAVTRLCQKALAAGDPAAVLQARADRELTVEKTAARMRRSPHAWTADALRDAFGHEPDWPAFEAEHAREPFARWAALVGDPDTPEDVLVRHASHLPAPVRTGRGLTAQTVRARVRHGVGEYAHEPLSVQLDHLLGSGLLTGRDLVHEAAPAALVLAYLSAALRRRDAPSRVRAAVAEAGFLVRRLGADDAAWQRVHARLTDRDPDWDPMSPVASLLAPKG